ncbi:hypothetical protein C0995_006267 [Termitomyces sp. Mi166|nr:hypothetical protein C0995_006267 [Termitomyces sp. Mi166\
MHALHSLAHRAPPATRTRVRWQPYSSIPACSTASSRSSPASYLNTPASSVTLSPHIVTHGNDHDRVRQILSTTTTIPKDIPNKDTPRNKYITSLVARYRLLTNALQDQAVKSLSEIWRPQDIPSVFVASAHTIVLGGSACEGSLVLDPKLPTRKQPFNTQLPSPISPSNRLSPSPSTASSPPSTCASLLTSESGIASTSGSRGNLVPIKSFVHEVLRRSRTSGCVLQTALCYLEAIRSKVPELVRAEKAGEGVQGEVDRSDWITPATPEELERERELAMDSDKDMVNIIASDDSLVPTVRVDDINPSDSLSQSLEHSIEDNTALNNQRLPSGLELPPLPPLPSPLLCPRRAFLASLILASKFTQDKCYSNRAWAKLSGLPPREIGRCERALGEALDWRLWVGKQPPAAPPSPPLPSIHRPLTRVRSESCLKFKTRGSFFVREEKKVNVVADIAVNRGLRRHRTLPADAFAPSSSTHISLDQVPWRTSTLSSESDTQDDDKMDLSGQLTPTEPHTVTGNTRYPSLYSHSDKINQSPSPLTPSLTYSPSSTDSCSGDRMVQTSSFLDDPTATFNPGKTNGSESWPWLDNSDGAPYPNIAQSIRINRKISSPLGGPFDSASSIDITGPTSFKIADIDGDSRLYLLASVSGNASAYPSGW